MDEATLRRLALSFPDALETSARGQLAFAVAGKGFAWSFMERAHPKKPRAPRADILAIRCPLDTKEMLVEAAPDRFFDDEHYRGYPAVLVRLEAIEADEFLGLLRSGWRLVAPKAPVERSSPP